MHRGSTESRQSKFAGVAVRAAQLRQRLVTDIESMGYCLVDSWEVPERHFYLSGHPEKSSRGGNPPATDAIGYTR